MSSCCSRKFFRSSGIRSPFRCKAFANDLRCLENVDTINPINVCPYKLSYRSTYLSSTECTTRGRHPSFNKNGASHCAANFSRMLISEQLLNRLHDGHNRTISCDECDFMTSGKCLRYSRGTIFFRLNDSLRPHTTH